MKAGVIYIVMTVRALLKICRPMRKTVSTIIWILTFTHFKGEIIWHFIKKSQKTTALQHNITR